MKYFRVENFLSAQENQSFLAWCVNNSQAFTKSTVTTNEEGYRKSSVTYSCPLLSLVTYKIEKSISVISNALELAIAEISSLESQVTAHANGDYFKIHTDKNDQHCSHRVISYVYYFHIKPKSFEGGELALYSDCEKSNRVLITPDNNTLVCFPSTTWHEVLPVAGNSAFDSCRFTVNGWISFT